LAVSLVLINLLVIVFGIYFVAVAYIEVRRADRANDHPTIPAGSGHPTKKDWEIAEERKWFVERCTQMLGIEASSPMEHICNEVSKLRGDSLYIVQRAVYSELIERLAEEAAVTSTVPGLLSLPSGIKYIFYTLEPPVCVVLPQADDQAEDERMWEDEDLHQEARHRSLPSPYHRFEEGTDVLEHGAFGVNVRQVSMSVASSSIWGHIFRRLAMKKKPSSVHPLTGTLADTMAGDDFIGPILPPCALSLVAFRVPVRRPRYMHLKDEQGWHKVSVGRLDRRDSGNHPGIFKRRRYSYWKSKYRKLNMRLLATINEMPHEDSASDSDESDHSGISGDEYYRNLDGSVRLEDFDAWKGVDDQYLLWDNRVEGLHRNLDLHSAIAPGTREDDPLESQRQGETSVTPGLDVAHIKCIDTTGVDMSLVYIPDGPPERFHISEDEFRAFMRAFVEQSETGDGRQSGNHDGIGSTADLDMSLVYIPDGPPERFHISEDEFRAFMRAFVERAEREAASSDSSSL
jgi:hypothetical protein